MHPYSIDTNERKSIYFALALVSLLLALVSYNILSWLKINMPWWVDFPSVMAFYGLLCIIFNEYCWKWTLFKKIGLVKTPNLNGEWIGHLQSSYDDFKSKTDTTLRIRQNWTQINIVLSTNTSSSYSETASIITSHPKGIVLSYQYCNEPQANVVDKMHIHHGTTLLELNTEANTLHGEYYSGRDRANFGTLELKRK